MEARRYAIIDIGSNSIRLVIYEKTETGAYRVVDGNKRAARLSSKINEVGELSDSGIQDLIETIQLFITQTNHHKVQTCLAIATAAIRNAANQQQIIQRVYQETKLKIQVFTGEEEAEHGFIGMINSLPIESGFLIDIGGGSTEITLFIDRKITHTHSFPFGCVSLNKKYDNKNGLSDLDLNKLTQELLQQLQQHEWMSRYTHLPLVCIGGTARALAKIHQASINYPYQQTHHYLINQGQVSELFQQLRATPVEQRKRRPGLSKDRVDVIVPGVAILKTVFNYIQATHFVICGAGLRDGIFHKMLFPQSPILKSPLAFSVNNLLALHTAVPRSHIEQVNQLSLSIFDALHEELGLNSLHRSYLDIASKLYRIGATIDYYDYNKHSFYLIIHSRLNGIMHRDILLIAAIAAYKSKNKTRANLKDYAQLISETELNNVYKLGTILQLAICLDRTETQAIEKYTMELNKHQLKILVHEAKHDLLIERNHVASMASDMKKLLGIKPIIAFE